MTKLAFVDTETTGLDPDRHSIWEVGLIVREDGHDDVAHVWQFPIVELEADPFALNIGHYWERHWDADPWEISDIVAIFDAHKRSSRRKNFPSKGRAIRPSEMWAQHFRDLTADAHLVGAVVSFDEERLRKLLRRFGVLPRWHYHLVDVEALAAAHLAQSSGNRDKWQPPWDSTELSLSAGIDPNEFDRHTALGDAQWARAIYDAVMTNRDVQYPTSPSEGDMR